MHIIASSSTIPLHLSFCHTEAALQTYFEERLSRPVLIIFTDNSTSMLSARMKNKVLHIRVHRLIQNADYPVIDDIVFFLKNRTGTAALFRKFFRDNKDRLSKRPPRRVSIKTQGNFHDLCALYSEINRDYFSNTINAGITWGSRCSRCSVRKRTLGSYSDRSHMIRINPVLDKRTVPRYVVASIVYHEMLHADMGTPQTGKRRSIHSREFRRREKLFQDYERAKAWERSGVP